MKIRIVAVGKLKEQGTKDLVAEFEKRIGKFARVETMEIKESSPEREAGDIIEHVLDGYCIVLERQGKTVSSEDFAEVIRKESMRVDITFIIGGPNGVTEAVRDEADLLLSFGPMTFTHQLARVMLLEQIYRAFTIIHGLPYHK